MFSWKTDTLRVPTLDHLPTEPYISCNWDDGMSTVEELFVMSSDNNMATEDDIYIYNVEHPYQTHGVYFIECTMRNMVSEQSLSHQVLFKIRVLIYDLIKGTN